MQGTFHGSGDRGYGLRVTQHPVGSLALAGASKKLSLPAPSPKPRGYCFHPQLMDPVTKPICCLPSWPQDQAHIILHEGGTSWLEDQKVSHWEDTGCGQTQLVHLVPYRKE